MEQADELFSEYIRRRDKTCLYGKDTGEECYGALQCSHVISKGSCSELRYEPRNAICLCKKHHIYGWHSFNPIIYTDWYTNKFPRDWKFIQKKYEKYKLETAKGNAYKPKEHYASVIRKFTKLIEEQKCRE